MQQWLFWSKEWSAAMADKITDFVYADESKETIDVINVLLLGWILLGLVVYVLGNVIAGYWRKKKIGGKTPDGPAPQVADDTEAAPPTSSQEDPCTPEEQQQQEEEEEEGDLACEGDDPEFCEWMGKTVAWVKAQRVVSPIVDAWMDAINANTRIAATEHGLLVDFRDLLPTSQPPKVRRLTQTAHNEVECEVEMKDAAFELGVSRSEGGKRQPPLPYVLLLHHLQGKVCVDCNPNDLSFVARYAEPPSIDLHAEPSNDLTVPADSALCDVVREVSRDALRRSVLRLRLACFPDCPRPPHSSPMEDELEGKELLVKVVRADNLSSGGRPYCVVEVDDPPQRHVTAPSSGTDPRFDHHFTILVKDSSELLFEVYDKDASEGEEEQLGVCMVEVCDLLRHPRQRQVVPLNPPATLTLEFVFPDRVETNSRVTASGTLITTTTIERAPQECSSVPLEPNANPNSHLHGTEEMLHSGRPVVQANNNDETPNTLAELSLQTLDQPVPSVPKSEPAQSVPNSDPVQSVPKADSAALNGDVVQNSNSTGLISLLKADLTALISAQEDDSSLNDDSTAQNFMKKADSTAVNSALLADLTAQNSLQEDDTTVLISTIEADLKDLNSLLRADLNALNSAERDDLTTQNSVRKADSTVLNDSVQKSGSATLSTDSVQEADLTALNSAHEADPADLNFKQEEDLTAEIKKRSVDLLAHSEPQTVDLHAEGMETEVESVAVARTSNSNPHVGNGHAEQQKSHQENGLRSKIPVIRPPRIPPAILVSEGVQEPPGAAEGDRGVAGRALAQLGASPSGTSRSTLIIHSVHRPDSSLASSPSHSEPPSPPPNHTGAEVGKGGGVMRALRRRLSLRSRSSERSNPASPRHHTLGSSTRSSLSEASGVSAATFVHENSTLVIETNENGILKRYLIPAALAGGSSRRRPRGTKLHIYNDHIFVAKHITGSVECVVCRRHLTRRPGKQGYECRGCSVRVHKSCHVRVQDFCPNSSVNAMEVEYIHDPKGPSPKSI